MTRQSIARDDSGISLVELLVYIALATVVGIIVAGILINSFRVQTQVQDASTAAQGTYLVADAMGAAVRDSTALNSATLADGTTIVRTRSLDPSVGSSTTVGPEAFVCYAFALVGNNLLFTTSAAAISVSSAADTVAWTTIAEGVGRADSAIPPLQVVDSGTALRLELVSQRGDGGPQQLSTTIRTLQAGDPVTGERVSTPCF